MSTVYKYAIVLALAQAVIAADETAAMEPEPMVPDSVSNCEAERAIGEFNCVMKCPDCDCKAEWGYSCDDDGPSAGEKIKDALDDIWNRYADNEAIEQWAEQTQKDVDEMEQRQQQESLEFAEEVG